MRTSIEQIIGGRRYSTETADVITSNEYWDGSNLERSGRNMHLYKTKKGRFFVGYSTQWQGERNYIEPVSDERAMELYEELPVHEMTYEEAFGKSPEEA